jgi:AGCS family alanine or glycine:cation symporter
MSIITGAVVLGGINSIGRVAGILVPFMAVMYLSAGLFILLVNYQKIFPAFQLIFSSAFSGQAATGGFIGSSMMLAVQYGVSKGVFSNEAGLGSLAIAASTAKVDHPAEQGLFAISGVFISTLMVCTITGLVLAVTGVLGAVGTDGQIFTGSSMAMAAFDSVVPGLKYVVLLGLILFAFTTVLAWGYYGEKCVEYMLGLKAAYIYRWIYTLVVFVGAIMKLDLVWALSDIANGFMAVPNLIAIILLAKVVKKETEVYFNDTKDSTPEAVTEPVA